LAAHDVSYRVKHLRLLDDLRPVLGDAALLLPGDEHGGTAGYGVAQ
jgi:hypothetical protein